MSIINHEEAAHIANEFVSSIDNLHLEIQFLLNEIKRKDSEVVELESKLYKKTADIFRRSTNTPISPKEQQVIDRARESFDRIDKLAEEKVILAQRLHHLASKTVGRLDYDLGRIKVVTGDPTAIEPLPTPSFRPVPPPPVSTQQSLHSSLSMLAAEVPVPAPPAPVALSSQKRRRLNANASAAMAGAPVQLTAPVSRSRHPPAQQQAAAASPAPSRRRETSRMVVAEDLDMDEDTEEAGKADEEDNAPYCYCHQPSHGEMIACDGEECPYEWFHLGCLGLKHPPKGAWFCTECTGTVQAEPQPEKGSRKGRR